MNDYQPGDLVVLIDNPEWDILTVIQVLDDEIECCGEYDPQSLITVKKNEVEYL